MVILSDDILVVLILGCLSLSGLILLLTIYYKIRFYNRDKRQQRITKVFNKFLVNYMIGNEQESALAASKIKQFAYSRETKNILIKQLIVLHHNFSGQYTQKIYNLYRDLQLCQVSLKKLNRWGWEHKVRGMYELSMLEFAPAFDKIAKLIYHRNGEVRRNARVAIVKLKKKEGLLLLKDLKGSLSPWTFINITAILKRTPVKLEKAEIDQLKLAKNDFVKQLAIPLEKTVYVK